MTQQRLLDVIIPTFNRPSRVFSLLQSGIELALEGVYFIVIDDGSTSKEHINGVGELDTLDVCKYFKNANIIYLRNKNNIGLACSWMEYYQQHCNAKYTMSVVDKDVFINREPILGALNKLEQDPSICMVVIPIFQKDRSQDELIISANYTKMSGKKFITKFINDPKLQHCSSYGVKRVSSIKNAKVPNDLKLRQYGLDDGFGIDINLVLLLAAQGYVDFEHNAHIKRNIMGGGTERYPLTFAYTYYQYAKYTLNVLKNSKLVNNNEIKSYIKNWLLLVLRGLVVAYRPVHGSEKENGTSRIANHLKIPIHIYLVKELLKYRIIPSKEMLNLYNISARFTFYKKTEKLRAKFEKL